MSNDIKDPVIAIGFCKHFNLLIMIRIVYGVVVFNQIT